MGRFWLAIIGGATLLAAAVLTFTSGDDVPGTTEQVVSQTPGRVSGGTTGRPRASGPDRSGGTGSTGGRAGMVAESAAETRSIFAAPPRSESTSAAMAMGSMTSRGAAERIDAATVTTGDGIRRVAPPARDTGRAARPANVARQDSGAARRSNVFDPRANQAQNAEQTDADLAARRAETLRNRAVMDAERRRAAVADAQRRSAEGAGTGVQTDVETDGIETTGATTSTGSGGGSGTGGAGGGSTGGGTTNGGGSSSDGGNTGGNGDGGSNSGGSNSGGSSPGGSGGGGGEFTVTNNVEVGGVTVSARFLPVSNAGCAELDGFRTNDLFVRFDQSVLVTSARTGVNNSGRPVNGEGLEILGGSFYQHASGGNGRPTSTSGDACLAFDSYFALNELSVTFLTEPSPGDWPSLVQAAWFATGPVTPVRSPSQFGDNGFYVFLARLTAPQTVESISGDVTVSFLNPVTSEISDATFTINHCETCWNDDAPIIGGGSPGSGNDGGSGEDDGGNGNSGGSNDGNGGNDGGSGGDDSGSGDGGDDGGGGSDDGNGDGGSDGGDDGGSGGDDGGDGGVHGGDGGGSGIEENPVVVNDFASVDFGAAVVIDVLSNDSAATGATLDPSSVTVVVPPEFGTTAVNPLTGAITYMQNGQSVLGDDFTYTVRDSVGRVSAEAQVFLTIGGGSTSDDGVSLVWSPIENACGPVGNPANDITGMKTNDLYLRMDGPHRVLSVFMGEGSAANIGLTISGGTFFQHTFGTNRPPGEQDLQTIPCLAFDSYLTIGTANVQFVNEPNATDWGSPVRTLLFTLDTAQAVQNGGGFSDGAYYLRIARLTAPAGVSVAGAFEVGVRFSGTGEVQTLLVNVPACASCWAPELN